METKSQPNEKKAYHIPELQSFGSVQEGTRAALHGTGTDGGVYPSSYVTYSTP